MSDIKNTDDTKLQTDVKKITVRELIPYSELIKQYVEKCDVEGKDPEDYKNIENKVLIEALDSLTVGKFPEWYRSGDVDGGVIDWQIKSPIAKLYADEKGHVLENYPDRYWVEFFINEIFILPSDLIILLLDKFFVGEFNPNKRLMYMCEHCYHEEYDHFPVVKWLVDKFPGVDPYSKRCNRKDLGGETLTAFEYACKAGHLKIVQLFIDLFHEDSYLINFTLAYELAQGNKHDNICAVLKNNCKGLKYV